MPRPRRDKSRRETKGQQRKARETQVPQQKAEQRRLTPEQYTRRRVFGWALVALAVSFGASHWLAHLGLLYDDRPLWDLTIGYPMAAFLGVCGAIVLSR